MEINTKLLHAYPVIDTHTGASSIPKHQASTFRQVDVAHHTGFKYTRFGNPTIDAVEKCIAALENARYGLAFGSGTAAITSVLFLLSNGDHLVLGKNIYGGTFQLVNDFLLRFGITVTFVDESNISEWAAAVQPNTKLFYLETPSNPLLTITDIQAVTTLAKENNILVACDNTFMTPLGQHPLELGADIVIHSASKFLNGHSDVVAGVIATNGKALYEQLKIHQKALGGIIGIEEAWLLLRGVKTMGLRMEKAIHNANDLAHFLQSKQAVTKIYYPGLSSHPNFTIHQQQAENNGAVLAFELENLDQVARLFKNCQLPLVAVSLGGVETILSYPWKMSHACMSEDERLKMGVTPTLLRLSCGIEDITDLIADFDNCL